MLSNATQSELDRPYPLSPEQIRQFREDGFIKLKNVFSPETLAAYESEFTRLVDAINPLKNRPMQERTTYQKAFIQITNLWTKSVKAREFAFGRRLARLAAELLGSEGVRMWHDQSLYKEPGGGHTPWHVDQYYWPMATGKSVTAWIPLQAVPLDMGPMCFGRGSHIKNIGRQIEISDESEEFIREQIRTHGLLEVQEPFDLGEVSFHCGWTLHRASPNQTNQARKVHTVIYMDMDMRLATPKNKNQQVDWEVWTPSTQIGEIMDDPLNPILYCRDDSA